MVIRVEITGPDLELLVKQFGEDLDERLDQIVLKAGQMAEGPMRREIMGRLAKDPTGRMARSVTTEVDTKGAALVGPTVPYAQIQNDGGIIHAAGKKLSIPLSFGRVPRGMAPRDWPGGQLKLIPRKGKDSLLAVVSKGKIDAKYVLKDKVTIKGVNYLEATEDAVAADIEEFIAQELAALVVEAVEKAESTSTTEGD